MKKIFLLLTLLVLTMLAGCDTMLKQPPQWRNVFVKPTAAMTKDCPITAPPDKKAFMAASENERLKILGTSDIQHLGDLQNCNEQWKALRQWYAEQEVIYTKGNPK